MGFKLLLADDSITIQKVVNIIFANEEYELTIVDNGDAALEKAAGIIPDIMLVDTLMPGTSGYDVCQKVRQDQVLKDVPLLLLTGAFEPFDVDKARESGADDFISKPFESQVLIEKVKTLVQLGQERRTITPAAAPTPTPSPVPPPEKDIWNIDVAPEPLPVALETPGLSPAVSSRENIWGTSESDVVAREPVDPFGDISFPAPEPAESASAVESSFVLPEEPFAEEVPPVADAVSGDIEQVAEVSPNDDLWGAFELEPVEEGREEPVHILETYTVEPDVFTQETTAGPAASGEFGIPEADESVVGGAVWEGQAEEVSPLPEEAPVPITEEFAPVMETSFGDLIQDEPFETPAAANADFVEPAQPASYFFAEPAESSPFASPATEALLEEPPVVSAPPEPPKMPAMAPAADTGSLAGMTEEQLAAVITRVSREVIEKVVWEVVPDLAEILIKEEIRKIKEGR